MGAGLTGWRELTVPDLILLLSNVRDLISEVYDKLSRPRPRCEIETMVHYSIVDGTKKRR